MYEYEPKLNPKLRPCPFCGSQPVVIKDSLPEKDLFYISCGNENCDVVPDTRAYKTVERAAADWNRRIDDGGKWINVGKELPGPHEPVLMAVKITDAVGQSTYMVVQGGLDDYKWAYIGVGCAQLGDRETVTHWQRLPDPPKDEED